MRTRTRRRLVELLVLLSILGTAAAVRLPALPWSVKLEHQPEPVVPRTDEGTFYGHFKFYPKYHNVYPPQTAIHALVIEPVVKRVARLFNPKYVTGDYHIYLTGRIATFIAGLGFLVLIFYGGRAFGLKSLLERSLATALLALSPLISVYGHLFLADSINILWIWLAYFAFVRCLEHDDERYAMLFALASGFAFSTKLATTYCVIPGLALLFCSRRPFTRAVTMAFVAVGAVWVGSGFTYEMTKLEWTYRYLGDIQTAGAQDVDVVRNLRNQSTFFLSGLGIPTSLIAAGAILSGLWRLLAWGARLVGAARSGVLAGPLDSLEELGGIPGLRRRAVAWIVANPMTVIYAGLLGQFALFATVDLGGSFARHVIPFLPPVVIAGVRFACRLPWMRLRPAQVLTVALLLGYQLVLCLDGERAYYEDPRVRARAWLRKHRPKTVPVVHGPYSYLAVAGLPLTLGERTLGPSPLPRIGGDHFFITQQAAYGRYLLADSCEKIHHCFGGERARRFFVDLVTGRSKKYRLVREVAPGYIMPEFKLLGRVVPTHPYPEVGKVLIFRSVARRKR